MYFSVVFFLFLLRLKTTAGWKSKFTLNIKRQLPIYATFFATQNAGTTCVRNTRGIPTRKKINIIHFSRNWEGVGV